jgi:hypothetical protein
MSMTKTMSEAMSKTPPAPPVREEWCIAFQETVFTVYDYQDACEQARRLSLMAHVVDVYSVKRGFNGAVYLNTEATYLAGVCMYGKDGAANV